MTGPTRTDLLLPGCEHGEVAIHSVVVEELAPGVVLGDFCSGAHHPTAFEFAAIARAEGWTRPDDNMIERLDQTPPVSDTTEGRSG